MKAITDNLVPVAVGLCLLAAAAINVRRFTETTEASKPAYDQPTVNDYSNSSGGRPKLSTIYTVVGITDGDSLTAVAGGKEEKIRLCGVDAPERQQPLGSEATERLRTLVEGKAIAVTETDRDRYGRLVAEVFIPGEPEVFIQEELLKSGSVYVYPQYVGNCPNGDGMKVAEAIGQEQKAGVWSGSYERPWVYRNAN